eukprot:7495811-Lingulodinium_polyedra.AAC.1
MWLPQGPAVGPTVQVCCAFALWPVAVTPRAQPLARRPRPMTTLEFSLSKKCPSLTICHSRHSCRSGHSVTLVVLVALVTLAALVDLVILAALVALVTIVALGTLV